MELHNDAVPDYQPLLLLRNVSYPTYQLHVFAGGKNSPVETVLKIAILETAKWLRQRFRAFELPEELKMPEPEDYEMLDFTALKSFHLDMGYKLQVIWLASQRIWTLQLTEPDLGTQPGQENQARPPVPGRLIETNISYCLVDNKVECGFKTMVHEPQGTDAFCEVFRLAFIKYLARSPLVGLWQTWQLVDNAHALTDLSDIKRLSRWLSDQNRTLPAVIFTEYEPNSQTIPSQIIDKKLPDFSAALPFSANYNRLIRAVPEKTDPVSPAMPLDISALTRYRMGYAMFFTLPASQREQFCRQTGQEPGNGDILIIEPYSLSGKVTRYVYNRIKRGPTKVLEELESFIQNYPKGKPLGFGSCVFLPQARELERDDVVSLHRSKEELAAFILEQKEETEQKFRQVHIKNAELLTAKDKQIERLKEIIEGIDVEKRLMTERAEAEKEDLQNQLREKDRKLLRLQILLDRPEKPADIAVWVEKYFADRLLLHDRAKDMLQKLPPSDADMPLICDALEYLAMEFRDRQMKLIDDAQCGKLCSEKYNRQFIVTSTKSTSVHMYPADYRIKYKIGFKGKPVETLMDLHLKVGNDPANLLRIYFLFDGDTGLVVVGSLPKHLKIKSYK